MGRQNVLFNSFTSGLLGAKLKSRVELAQYASGCKTLTNMVIMPQGGSTRRPGLKYIATQKTPGEKCRVIPFRFSDTVAYIIEIGVGYFRFYKSGAQVLSGGSAYEISNSYTETQLFEITYTQSGDVLYLFHPSHHPKRLSRFADAEWAFTDIPFEDGPYLDQNSTDITITPGDMYGIRTNLYGVAGGGTKIAAVGVPFKKGNTIQGTAQYLTPGTSIYTWNKGTGKLRQKAMFACRYLNADAETKWGAVGNEGEIMESTDGIAWSIVGSTGLTSRLNDLVWDSVNSKIIVVGDAVGGAGIIRTYDDDWGSGSTKTSGTVNDLNGICFNGLANPNDLSVVVGDGGTILTSADSSSWSSQTSNTSKNLYSVCYASSLYVAVGEDGTILTSPNGVTWTARTSGVSVDLKHIIHDGTNYIVVGDKGYILTSANGTTWFVRNYYPDINLRAVGYISGHYVAVGTDGIIAYSTNGTVWVYRSIQTSTLTATGDVFDSSNDIGRHIRLAGKGIWSWGKILTVTNPTTALIEVRTRVYTNDPTGDWQIGAFYTSNYPKCGTFYEQRFMMGGTPTLPCTVWGSVSADYTNFAPTTLIGGTYEVITGAGNRQTKEEKNVPGVVTDASALSYTLYGTTINTIKWMMPTKVLLIGTVGAIKKLSGSSPDASLTPFNVVVSDQSAYGVADVSPVKVGYSLLYPTRIAKKIRELHYQFEVDQLVSPDVTIMCSEITDSGIKEMAFQQEPFNIIWCVTNSGNLIGLTYDADQKVVGWHKHTTTGIFESVACIPGTTEDEMWAVVNRTVGGTPTRYIEQMQVFDLLSTLTNSFFADAGVVNTGGVVGLTGLAHLNGIECSVLGDGLVQANKTPSAGAATIDTAAAKVVIGIPYTSELSTMDITGGPIKSQMKKLGNVATSLYETGEGVEIGYDSSNYDEVMQEDLPAGYLTTVDKIMQIKKGYEREQYVYVRQDHPLPLTVLSIAVEVLSNER